MADTTTSAATVTKPDVALQAHPQIRNVASVDMLTPVTDLSGVSNKWTELVKVEVGSEKQPFVFHRYILERSPFFEGCLRSTCKETESGVVQLPHASPEAFELVLDYLLTRTLDVEKPGDYKTNTMSSQAYALTLAKTYSLAKFVMLEELCNRVVDLYLRHCMLWVDGCEILEYLHSQDLEDSKLMDLIMACRVRDLQRRGLDDTNSVFLDHYVKSDSNRVKKIVGALLLTPVHLRTVKSACRWHTHDVTLPCAP